MASTDNKNNNKNKTSNISARVSTTRKKELEIFAEKESKRLGFKVRISDLIIKGLNKIIK